MNHDLRESRSVVMFADKIHLRFDDGEILLRATLKYKSTSELGDVRDARHVKKHILGKHGCQAGEDLFRPPALALEVDDV